MLYHMKFSLCFVMFSFKLTDTHSVYMYLLSDFFFFSILVSNYLNKE